MKPFRLNAEIVTGKCPTCNELTMLVGLTKEYYRCMTCGADLEQHVNGKISYIPALSKIHYKQIWIVTLAKIKGFLNKVAHEPVFHKTSIGRKPSLTKMNKSRRRSFKKYRGQGK